MAIERRFLGWERPALEALVSDIIARHGIIARPGAPGRLDLQDVTIVFPGTRPGRRFLELLGLAAGARELFLSPPRIMTPGSLPEAVLELGGVAPSELHQSLAWLEVLRERESRQPRLLVRDRPDPDDLAAWQELSESIRAIYRELASEGLRFEDVARSLGADDPPEEARRWAALAELRDHYFAELARTGHGDPDELRRQALARGAFAAPGELLLVGLVDPGAFVADLLTRLPRVVAYILAPAELSAGFRPDGAIVPEFWRERRLPESLVTLGRGSRLRLADRPADQARLALGSLAERARHHRLDELSLGVPDPEVLPSLIEELETQGLRGHLASGEALVGRPELRLIEALRASLEGARFSDFAALVRHPQLEDWLYRETRRSASHWIEDLDRYAAEHLPQSTGSAHCGDDARAERLDRLTTRLDSLLAPLRGAPRALSRWPEALSVVLARVYARELDPSSRRDRRQAEVFENLREELESFTRLPTSGSGPVSAAGFLRLFARSLGRRTLAPEVDARSVELLGWLELPLDDHPALVVTGLNEGFVPGGVPSDLFLPDGLRRRLGLSDERRRAARDAWVLETLLSSRDTIVIAGRRSARADPLLPSRLLFAVARDELPRRVRRLLIEPTDLPRPLEGALEAGQADLPPFFEAPTAGGPALESLSVTAFRTYLECPYLFWLRHVARLRRHHDRAQELDALGFGNLVHEVLADFGTSEVRDLSEAEDISNFLSTTLDRRVEKLLGESPRAAVYVQTEHLRARLEAFARWQASHRRRGWRIAHVEVGVSKDEGPSFECEAGSLRIHGRIDRIDVNESLGQWRVFDYKTGNEAKPPEATHRRRSEWIDLQLPLYRHLVRRLDLPPSVGLGYIVLPRATSQVGELMADWSEAELLTADDAARQVVASILRREFWPPRDKLRSGFAVDEEALLDEARRSARAAQAFAERAADPPEIEPSGAEPREDRA